MARFKVVKNNNTKQITMDISSTQNLLVLHAYGETSNQEKEFLAKELIKDPALQEDLVELIRVKRTLNSELKSPSASSLRIIMEHSYKTEHLQEM